MIGGGTMGAGIAQVLLEAGCEVVLVEADDAAAARARSRVAEGLARRKGVAPEEVGGPGRAAPRRRGPRRAARRRRSWSRPFPRSPPPSATCWRRPRRSWRPGALLASNTSSLSIGDLAGALERPERFLGMHFFNPVPLSALVEIVVGEGTAPAAVDDARRWVARLGKESIEVRDSPGFATSRLGVALGLEAIRMLEEGVATAADIDAGMVLGYRHPMGPLRLTDLVGLDVRLGHRRAPLRHPRPPVRAAGPAAGQGRRGASWARRAGGASTTGSRPERGGMSPGKGRPSELYGG